MAHLAPCLTLTGRPCFYSRQSFEVLLLCSVQVTEFQLEYSMHACSSDFVHYGNMKLSPSLIHQARIQGGRRPCPTFSLSETCHQTSDQYLQPAMGFSHFSFCFGRRNRSGRPGGCPPNNVTPTVIKDHCDQGWWQAQW